MILVITTQAGDYSHMEIINWLKYKEANFFVLTGESILSGDQFIEIRNNEVICDGINLTRTVTSVFYRRWINGENIGSFLKKIDNKLTRGLTKNILLEMIEIRDFLYHNLINATWIPSPYKTSVNKINNLSLAKEQGLSVPKYLVTNSKEKLNSFFNKCNKKVITKAIGNFHYLKNSSKILVNPIYIKRVVEEDLQILPKKFVPTFFQEMIEKEYEYRILYFNEKVYSIMLLSQEIELTKVDSRRTSDNEGSRLVPAILPPLLKNKIVNFMNSIELNIGCLDFIYSKSHKEFYFLEVNPVGQFGGYSERCLLDFEKDIVNYLYSIDESTNKNNSKLYRK